MGKEPTYSRNGDEERWMLKDRLHRLDGPALIRPDYQEYRRKGRKHRANGPAIIVGDGTHYEYWKSGKRHRTDGPALFYPDLEEWWKNGKLHREGGKPAVIDNRKISGINHLPVKIWYFHGKLHNREGPSMVYTTNADSSIAPLHWHIHGIQLTFDEWLKKAHPSKSSIMYLKLKYGNLCYE